MTYPPDTPDLFPNNEQPEPSPCGPCDDISWVLIGIDRGGSGHILDAAQGFYDKDLFEPYMDAEEAGVFMPKNITPGAYKITNISIGGGGPDHNGEYWGPEISGTWENLTLDYAYD